MFDVNESILSFVPVAGRYPAQLYRAIRLRLRYVTVKRIAARVFGQGRHFEQRTYSAVYCAFLFFRGNIRKMS